MLDPILELKALPRSLRVYVDAGSIRVVVSPRTRKQPWLACTWAEPRECCIDEVAGDPVLRVGVTSFDITNSEALKLLAGLQLRDARKARESEGITEPNR